MSVNSVCDITVVVCAGRMELLSIIYNYTLTHTGCRFLHLLKEGALSCVTKIWFFVQTDQHSLSRSVTNQCDTQDRGQIKGKTWEKTRAHSPVWWVLKLCDSQGMAICSHQISTQSNTYGRFGPRFWTDMSDSAHQMRDYLFEEWHSSLQGRSENCRIHARAVKAVLAAHGGILPRLYVGFPLICHLKWLIVQGKKHDLLCHWGMRTCWSKLHCNSLITPAPQFMRRLASGLSAILYVKYGHLSRALLLSFPLAAFNYRQRDNRRAESQPAREGG